MATLRVVPEDAATVRIVVDGVEHQFEDGYLEVDDATAQDIRRQGKTLFPHLGIHVVEPEAAAQVGEAGEAAAAADATTEGQPATGTGEAGTPPAGDAPKPLARMNLEELQAAGAAKGIATEGLTKAQIRAQLEA